MIKITERGWAGHYCCSKDCLFRRNTLVEYDGFKLVVSTVGHQIYTEYSKNSTTSYGMIHRPIPIGFNRYYETMVFESLYDKYNDANIKNEIDIWTECGIYGET